LEEQISLHKLGTCTPWYTQQQSTTKASYNL
jgi:hypothetical protein